MPYFPIYRSTNGGQTWNEISRVHVQWIFLMARSSLTVRTLSTDGDCDTSLNSTFCLRPSVVSRPEQSSWAVTLFPAIFPRPSLTSTPRLTMGELDCLLSERVTDPQCFLDLCQLGRKRWQGRAQQRCRFCRSQSMNESRLIVSGNSGLGTLFLDVQRRAHLLLLGPT